MLFVEMEMLQSFLVTSRETLEASLVVGIVLAYLYKTNNRKFTKSVFPGVVAGILASILAAFLFHLYAGGIVGWAEEIFEGTTMLIGSFLLTTMIGWMMRQRHLAQEIEGKVKAHMAHANQVFSHLGIFLIIFIAILREGVETVIFLNAAHFAGGVNFMGGLLGVVAAIIAGYLFFLSSHRINLKRLFSVSSVLLIFFAAGLVAHGVHELEEAGLLNGIITPLFDINPSINPDGSVPWLHEQGVVGSFLKGLFGYNGNPSLLEVISYTSYLGIIGAVYWRTFKSSQPANQHSPI